MHPGTEWLLDRMGDNRVVVGAFFALAIVNALALQAGYYR